MNNNIKKLANGDFEVQPERKVAVVGSSHVAVLNAVINAIGSPVIIEKKEKTNGNAFLPLTIPSPTPKGLGLFTSMKSE